MTSRELKITIAEDLKEIENEDTLNIIKSVIDTYKECSSSISDKRKEILDEAKQQFDNSEYFTDEDVNKEEDNWLKE